MPAGFKIAERRAVHRVQLILPIRIADAQSQWVDGETRDVGSGGFRLFLSKGLVLGREIEYIVSIPYFHSVKLRCIGRVLRSSDMATGGTEVAVTMECCAAVDADL